MTMTQTLTTTLPREFIPAVPVQPAAAPVQHEEVPQVEDCNDLIDRLAIIIDKYKAQKDRDAAEKGIDLRTQSAGGSDSASIYNPCGVLWTDPLSAKLFNWGFKVLTIPFPEDGEPTAEQLAIARNKVERLIHKTLVSPLGSTPFQPLKPSEPFIVLDRLRWPWAAWQFADYEKAFQFLAPQGVGVISPFDNQAHAVPRVHEFAEEMVRWSQIALRYLLRPQAESSSSSAAPSAPMPESSEPSGSFFSHLSLVPLSQGTSAHTQMALASGPSTQPHFNPALFLATHTLTNPFLQRVTNESKIRIYHSQAQVALRCWKLQEMRRTKKGEGPLLERVFEEMRKLVAQQGELLNAQEQERTQETDHKLEDIEQRSKQRATILNDRITAEVKHREQVEGRLKQAEATNEANLAEICGWRVRYAQKAAECENVKRENQGKGGGGCTIL